jgi:sigma-B regulation protein RsbU (phosphoserine phosphatase)
MKNEVYKILVADDSEFSYKIISETLDIIGNKVQLFYAEDGKKACQMAMDIIPDLILMDVIMPEMNGIDAVKYLRTNESTADIPIMVLSASESLNSAYESGANDFISKPFHRYELLIKVRSALNLVQKIKETKRQKEELEKKHLEVIEQRDQILQQRKEIIDDIQYSKRIQRAIFPTDQYMHKIIADHFILNLPKNIVSGDFYWVGELESGNIISIGDCTGHGISGAFMTMAGIAFLNQILSEKSAINANDILFRLREMVMKLLKQKGEEGEAADGMDISMVILNNDRSQLQFSGANNPLYIVRNGELLIYKGDRMPIGIHLHFEQSFTNHIIDIHDGDMIYLFTDGFADQFGGPFNKKFRYKQFQELLIDIHKKPVSEQNKVLFRTINDWKGDNYQVDDILILGFRI